MLGRLVVVALLSYALPLAAQDAPPPACAGPEHRAFDFWAGEWTVTNPSGDTLGWNRIEPVSEGCGLLENWTSARGPAGKSLNFYDRPSGEWHQLWVGGGGLILRLRGGSDEEGVMVLAGEPRPGPEGSTIRDRITWSLQEDGSVLQLWEVAPEGEGGEWTEVFRGVYRRR